MPDTASQFIEFLRRHDDEAWAAIVASLLPDVHPVDQNALRVWFAFYPVKLFRMLTEDEARARQDCLLNGRYRLADHIHTSHWFFYGHRFWPKVQKAMLTDLRTPPGQRWKTTFARRRGAPDSIRDWHWALRRWLTPPCNRSARKPSRRPRRQWMCRRWSRS
ncbi:hypothetical protein J8C07_00220 [Chloracidobacterium sp. S]|uniref:hypothetical protein n=1 Tax=Chloracidobacterium aggregatum TaxID=2851959 RepID=UPI001B8C5173|nr:hypothetical protein [Chloracidobacterium aggregatum]QUV87814.1 hypothetical protein J8C07_00220 [Chloracidobacterium sp. S]